MVDCLTYQYDKSNLNQMVSLIGRGWRSNLAELIRGAHESLVIAAPYIKHGEAAWVRDLLRPEVDILTLAHVQAEAV